MLFRSSTSLFSITETREKLQIRRLEREEVKNSMEIQGNLEKKSKKEKEEKNPKMGLELSRNGIRIIKQASHGCPKAM